MLCSIGLHRALYDTKIPFNDNFFHPARQEFSHLRILRLPQTGFKKRQRRVWAPCLRSHASGEPWEIGWAVRQAGRPHNVFRALGWITEQKVIVVSKQERGCSRHRDSR